MTPLASEFTEAVWALVRTVPAGRVTSYGEVAEAYYGVRRGSRGIGRALSGCPEDVPWWRVVRAGGALAAGTFAAEQRARLAEEGVPLTPSGDVWLPGVGGLYSPPAPSPDGGDGHHPQPAGPEGTARRRRAGGHGASGRTRPPRPPDGPSSDARGSGQGSGLA